MPLTCAGLWATDNIGIMFDGVSYSMLHIRVERQN